MTKINAETNEQFVQERSNQLAYLLHQENHRKIDKMFVALMLVQWIAGIMIVLFVSPYTWIGEKALVHNHLWAAIVLGGIISSAPMTLGILFPGRPLTRHVIAIAQALWGALLIHLTGGRIETHFHVFASLAFIAFYRDWKVLATMTVVVATDHAIRGIYFPLSVYGILIESPYRWIEHAVWVLLEDVVLILACVRGRNEAKAVCDKQAELELTNQQIEQKVLERSAELEDAKVFLQSVLDSISAHICVLDKNGVIVETNAFWNQFAEENEGAHASVGVGANYLEVCRNVRGECEDGANSVADAIETVISGNQVQHVSEYPCHSPRSKNWFQVNVTPLKNHCRGAAVVAHSNITERVQAKLELEKTSEHLELLSLVAKYTDNAVVITDANGQIEWVNAGFTRITGYTMEDAFGKKPGSLLQGPDSDPKVVEYMRTQIKQKRGFDVELTNYSKSGEPYWNSIEARPIRDEDGEVVKFIAIESDISEKRQREQEKKSLSQQLQDAARQAGMAEVATGILHNVGNVLNSVNVSANLIKERLDSSPVSKLAQASQVIAENEANLGDFLAEGRGRYFPDLLKQLSNTFESELAEQLNEINSLSKNIEHIKEIVTMQQSLAKQCATTELIEPQELFNDAVKMHLESLDRHQVNVDCFFEDVPAIYTKRHEVIQILLNLIKNAQQALRSTDEDDKRISLFLNSNNNFVCFEVTDNGTGIEKEDLKKIFQRGFTTKHDGHGFGLHACANSANTLGGNLTVASLGRGKGATFKLKLPMKTKVANEIH